MLLKPTSFSFCNKAPAIFSPQKTLNLKKKGPVLICEAMFYPLDTFPTVCHCKKDNKIKLTN